MTLHADPIVGSSRIVVLAPSENAVFGTAAEFRRFGLSIVLRQDAVDALAELLHDPTALFVISSDYPCADLGHLLDVAVATCGSSVMLGQTDLTDAQTIARAMAAGVCATVDLPVRPHRLANLLRALPLPTSDTEPISVGSLTIDAGRHRLEWGGIPISVTPREFEVVLELARRYPRMATLDELASERAGAPADPHAAVRVVIRNVRVRIAEVSGTPGADIIETIRGIGYRLVG